MYAAADGTIGSVTLHQITGQSFSGNGQPIELVDSSGLDVPEHLAGPTDYRTRFSTTDLATLAGIAAFGQAGLGVVADTIAIPFRKRSPRSTFGGAGTGFVVSGTQGLAIPTRFEVPDTGDAAADVEFIHESTDGEAPPVTINAAATIAADAVVAKYGLGPLAITVPGPTTTVLDKIAGFTVNPGIEVRVEMYGANYARETFIVRRRPSIDIRARDLAALNAIGDLWQEGSAIVGYAKRRSREGFVADATASHVQFSLGTGVLPPGEITTSGVGEDAVWTRRFVGTSLVVALAAIN